MENEEPDARPAAVRITNLRTLALWAVALYLGYLLLDAIAVAALVFAVALLAAIALDAPVRWLDRRGFSRGMSVAVIIVTGITALGLGGYLAFRPIAREVHEALRLGPDYAARIENRIVGATSQYPVVADWVRRADLRVRLVRAEWLLPRVGRLSVSVAGWLAALAVALMVALYAVANPKPLVRGCVMAFPAARRKTVIRIIFGVARQVQAWVRATGLLMVIVGVACGLGLWALGVKPALLFGLLAGIGEAIPTIGPILSAIPPALVAFADEPARALWVLLLFLAVQQLEQNLLVPRVMAAALRLHPVSVLFFVMALGAALGPPGVLLAVPACAVTKVVYRELRSA